MLHPSIGLTAGFALAANAIMIPSTMLAPELGDDSAGWPSLDITRLVDNSRHERIVKLACHQCAFPVDGEKDVWTTDIANSLVFDFSTSEDGKAVILNGERIFPLDHAVQLKAPQVASDVTEKMLAESAEKFTTTPRQLDFAFASRTIDAADGTDAQLIDMDLRVFGIDGVPKDLDLLAIRLLRAEDGQISMASIDCVPNAHSAQLHGNASGKDETLQILPVDHKPHANNPVCNGAASFLCDWVSIMETKIASMRERLSHHGGAYRGHGRRPCPGRKGMKGPHGIPIHGGVPKFTKPPHPHGEPVPDMDGDDFRDMMMHHDKDGHAPHHHGHHGAHGHPRPHSFLGWVIVSAKVFFFNILVPVLIGVVAGMIAGALGMLAGTVIAWAWIKFVRGGRRGGEQQVAVVVVDDEDLTRGLDEEKTGLMEQVGEDVESPPVYAEKE